MNIKSMHGLGDNVYMRSFVRELPKPIWMDTSWPEIFDGIDGINFVKPVTRLRTQSKNVVAQSRIWAKQPRGFVRQISYGDKGIMRGLQSSFGVKPRMFDLPDYGLNPVEGKYIVIRSASVRSEWVAESRNPHPGYLQHAAAYMHAMGHRIVSVADFEDGKEWPDGELPYSDIQFHKGELGIKELLSLVKNSTAVIGGIGWLVPVAAAYRKKAWIVCGGWGTFNHPDKLTHPIMGDSITYAMPDIFCMCRSNNHKCNKEISNYEAMFAGWAEQLAIVER